MQPEEEDVFYSFYTVNSFTEGQDPKEEEELSEILRVPEETHPDMNNRLDNSAHLQQDLEMLMSLQEEQKINHMQSHIEKLQKQQIELKEQLKMMEKLLRQQKANKRLEGKRTELPPVPIPPVSAPPPTTILPDEYIINQPMNYSKQPSFQLFKRCSFLQLNESVEIYRSQVVRVTYTRQEHGIHLVVHNSDDYLLRVSSHTSQQLHIPFSRFAEGKFVQSCSLLRKDGTSIDLPIPLPLSFIFQKRLQFYNRNDKLQRLQKMMKIQKIVISHYDQAVWLTILGNPPLLSFSRDNNMLWQCISLSNTKEMFLIEMSVEEGQLTIKIGHARRVSSQRLKDLMQFSSFLLCN